jgi:aspartate racemase
MAGKIGLIGGLGWPATIAYYAGICRTANERGMAGTPQMTIESLDMSQTMAARGSPGDEASWRAFDRLFVDAIDRLATTGCDVCAIASVTPHNRLAAIVENASIPVISVVDAVSNQIRNLKLPSAVVLGTSVTMQGALFDETLTCNGFDVIRPGATDIEAFSSLLDRFFYSNQSADGRGELIDYVNSLTAGADDVLVLLACTDLNPAFPDAGGQTLFCADGHQFLDATAAHIDAIMQVAV